VTTKLEFSGWSQVFSCATVTAARLDWLTHHSQVLIFEGESYCFRESAGRLTKPRRNTRIRRCTRLGSSSARSSQPSWLS